MKKIALLCLVFFGCASTVQVHIPRVHSISMQDADAYILMIDDGSGALIPRKIFAENVKVVADVPAGLPMWAEHVDVPGEARGEGDSLILHVRSARDIE